MAVAVLPFGSRTWFKRRRSCSKIQVLEIKYVILSRDVNSKLED